MFKRDDLLQQKLLKIENGVSLEHVLSEVPTDDKELIDLIKVAAQIRMTHHPKPSLARKHALKYSLLQNTKFIPLFRKNGNGHDAIRVKKSRLAQKNLPVRSRLLLPQINLRWTSATPISSLLFVLGMIGGLLLLSIGVMWFSTPAQAQTAQLQNVSGIVEVADTSSGLTWKPLATGDKLRSGQRLRTEQHMDPERPALTHQAIEQQCGVLRDLVILDKELLELVDD